MAAPPVPSPLDCVGFRRFAFHPPLAHPDPNDWRVGRRLHEAAQFVNAQTGTELWIPSQYIGAVSESETALTVGLIKALDARSGTVAPREKRIIQMRPAIAEERPSIARSDAQGCPCPSIVAIRLESRADSLFNRAMVTACTVTLVVALLAALFTSAINF